MNEIAVIYHNWLEDGAEPFLKSYLERPAGCLHDLILTGRTTGWDLSAYLDVARAIPHRYVCCVNSYTRIRSTGWLLKLFRNWIPGKILGAFATREGGLLPFPNPHVRSNGFFVERVFFVDYFLPPVTKAECYEMEHGARGMSRIFDPLLVDRHGTVYSERDWTYSKTFRLDDQENLLLSDNHSRRYDQADEAERAQLRRLAWGDVGFAAGN